MQKPIIFAEGTYTETDIEQFKNTNKIWKIVDIFDMQIEELFEVIHPESNVIEIAQKQDLYSSFLESNELTEKSGTWVYFPWSGVLAHMVGEETLFKLRTNRNQNLINAEEQKLLSESVVGVLGLSVGNGIATTLAYSGISSHIKLADFDDLSTANLNRLKANITQVGEPKSAILAQQIYELNPFASIDLFEQGVQDKDLEAFFTGPNLSVVFDEIDDFPMKIKLRMKAREQKVPVIMLTSLGDSILIDVERYDTDENLALFNGLIGDTPEEILHTEIGEREKVKYAIDLIGTDYIPTRALESLFEINRTLVGRPQLASTVTIDGGIASFLVRRLLLGGDVPSGRYYLSLGTAIGIKDNDKTENHQQIIDTLNQMLGRG